MSVHYSDKMSVYYTGSIETIWMCNKHKFCQCNARISYTKMYCGILSYYYKYIYIYKNV